MEDLNLLVFFMFPDFLPAIASQLTEATSIQLAQSIQRRAIATSLCSQPIETSYVCGGEGNPPILLLHGFDSSVLEFRRLLPLLAQSHQTWAVDLLGFGFGDRVSSLTFSPGEIAVHLQAFWQQVIQRPAILVGASMGGAVAISLTLKYPEMVDKLVLLDSAGLAKPPKIGKLMFPPFDRLATGFLRNPRVRQSISQAAYFDKSFANEDARICTELHLGCSYWQEALVAFTKSGGYGSFAEQLPEIQQPTLIIWGENDQILGIKDASQFESLIPQSQLVWLSNCGHVPHLEQPLLTAEAILKFL